MKSTILRVVAIIGLAWLLVSCDTNPVTGKPQFTLMTQEQEINLGQQQYAPSQQAQGGSYVMDPQLNTYVNAIGQNLARYSDQPNLPYEFVVINSDVPNAWALPGGKIAINRGLLVVLEDEAQLAAVLAHEIVHAAARHAAEQQVTNLGLHLAAFAAATQLDNPWYRQATGLGALGAMAHYSRANELESDHYGIRYMIAAGYDPQGAVELQETFLRLAKEAGRRPTLFRAYLASHPPSAERVRRNRERANAMPGGKRNREAYLQATAQIRSDQLAYEQHQKALEAAADEQWQAALQLTDAAIQLQPREARFHMTRGRLLKATAKTTEAMQALNRAVELEPGYYAPHLHRGLLHQELDQLEQAERDLSTSYQLLPTQVASYYLGVVAQERGQ